MRKNLCYGLLACSVILNAFLAGCIFSGGMHHPPMPPSPLYRMERAASHLPPEYQKDVMDLIKGNQAQLDEDMKEMRSVFKEIHPVLTADKFDPQKLKDLHTKLNQRDEKVKDGMLKLLTGIAEKLPDAERIKFFSEINPENEGFHGPPPPDLDN